MRRVLFVLPLLMASVFWTTTCRADSVFAVDGTFQSGGTIRGTVTIDTTAGVVTDSTLAINADGLSFVLATPPTGQGPDLGAYYDFDYTFSLPSSSGNGLLLAVPQVSLVGYGGGPLCSAGVACLANESNLSLAFAPTKGGAVTDFLAAGTLSPVPEPTSLELLSLGCMTVGGMTRWNALGRGRRWGGPV